MPRVKFELDEGHPCLACGAAWRVRLDAIEVDGQVMRWQRGAGKCSAGCMTRDMEAYNRGLTERAERGWSQL